MNSSMKDQSKEPGAPENSPGRSKEGFDPQDLQKEFQDLIHEKFGGRVQVLSMGEALPFEEDNLESSPSATGEQVRSSIANFHKKPRDVKDYLDRFVIGQIEAKQALSIAVCDHYNHLRWVQDHPEAKDQSHYQKQNVLIMGPTGVGKTYLVKLIADLVGVPFVKADATRFSEVGYMGANVDDIIRDLVQKADGDKILASKGIVYVDEVDKLASSPEHRGRDVSGRGVQFGFLRLLENSDVDLNASHDIASQFKTFMNFQKKGKADKEIVNTRDILFIFSGAFHGLEDIISKRLAKKTIGVHAEKKSEQIHQLFQKAEPQDLVEFGFEHEFIGRLPVRVACQSLSRKDLLDIMLRSEESILEQYKASFMHYGIELKFTEAALELIAERAEKHKTGARGLVSVLEQLLRPFKFELPSTTVKDLLVDENLVRNPLGVLHHVLGH